MIIKTLDLIDNSYSYGVYEKGNFMDKTFGRFFGMYPTEIIDNLSSFKKAEIIFNNLVNYHEK